MEDGTEYANLIRITNKEFGLEGWSHSVVSQTIDFLDYEGDKYNIGVSALVKVVLKNGSYHEDIGYGLCKGLKCKGLTIGRARRAAARDGLKNALSAFEISSNVPRKRPSGSIANYLKSTSHLDRPLSLSQPVPRWKPQLLSGDKSNLSQDAGSFDLSQNSTTSGASKSSSQNSNVSMGTPQQHHHQAPEQGSPAKRRTIMMELHKSPQQGGVGIDTSSAMCSKDIWSSQDGKEWMERKLKQLELEMEARNKLKQELIEHLNK